MSIIKEIFAFFQGESMPPLERYAIPKRPQKEIKISGNRTTEAKVHNGKVMKDSVDDQGVITTEIGTQIPKEVTDVVLDQFDRACLDFTVGVKWKKDENRAIVIKWHWMKGESAAQVEKSHTDTKSGELQRGFSERTVTEFITSFYDADDQREAKKLTRLRPPRSAKIVEW